jgi:Holliday junction resolvasome RuvABC endonuclease subunit
VEHYSSRYTLAIDPGTRKTGVALFEGIKLIEAFTLKAPNKAEDSEVRAFNLIQILEETVMCTLNCPACNTTHAALVYENPQMFRIKGGLKAIEPVVRMAGMLSYWGMRLGFRVFPYKVTEVKAGITGRRTAHKEEVERVMHQILGLDGRNRADHEYDAMSVAVHHLDQQHQGCFGLTLPVT